MNIIITQFICGRGRLVVKMAARPHVQLSDLPVELDHSVIHENASGCLLVHTKLTETCLNAIDSLAASTVSSAFYNHDWI